MQTVNILHANHLECKHTLYPHQGFQQVTVQRCYKKHVVLEKPMALTKADCEKIRKLMSNLENDAQWE